LNNDDYFTKIYSFIGDDGMAIFYKNNSCDEFNSFVLNNISNAYNKKVFSIKGDLIGIKKLSYINGNQINSRIVATEKDYRHYIAYLKKESDSLVPFCLSFCIGSRVMLLKNINISDGLVNGRRGTVTDILFEDDVISAIVVKFDPISVFPSQEEHIIKMKVDTYKSFDGVSLNFYQFPLKLCYSITAHKSQGQTLSKVAVCITEKAFAHGSFYVALSRVRSFDDILFFGITFPPNGPSLHSNEFISDFNFKITHSLE